MTTINLKEFYPWYDHAEYIEVPDDVAEELKADKRYEQAYIRRVMRNKAQYSWIVTTVLNTQPVFLKSLPKSLSL